MDNTLIKFFIGVLLFWAVTEIVNPRNRERWQFILLFSIMWMVTVFLIWTGVL